MASSPRAMGSTRRSVGIGRWSGSVGAATTSSSSTCTSRSRSGVSASRGFQLAARLTSARITSPTPITWGWAGNRAQAEGSISTLHPDSTPLRLAQWGTPGGIQAARYGGNTQEP
ncbi:hypothetical protein N5C55_10010 [Pseudomonas otitidis]|nr:hypothetical protein [Pseudomonas otitidis]MDH1158501.1 hypothetical protein [Pseudomonas otitidis]MDH1162553.1 hypothetical protein [Pseudomonas otitidis]